MGDQMASQLMSGNSGSIRNLRSFISRHAPERLLACWLALNWFCYHFQRDIVRGVEGYIVTGAKQVEIGELVLSCRRMARNMVLKVLAPVAVLFASRNKFRAGSCSNGERAWDSLESSGVAEPLRAMIMGSPLEDARHLAQRYDRVRQEAESQAIEVSKRQSRVTEARGCGSKAARL
ncbi:hypothetical protein CRG98_040985 [Punica granatum]|uniref:Uncharacterized protein n=1 Tax=Punica granatum TaxID=22663 RepID=A0A2I0I3L8_PUNGR|nr:hypothetical protein CRG98_040985 [Punica granatum]